MGKSYSHTLALINWLLVNLRNPLFFGGHQKRGKALGKRAVLLCYCRTPKSWYVASSEVDPVDFSRHDAKHVLFHWVPVRCWAKTFQLFHAIVEGTAYMLSVGGMVLFQECILLGCNSHKINDPSFCLALLPTKIGTPNQELPMKENVELWGKTLQFTKNKGIILRLPFKKWGGENPCWFFRSYFKLEKPLCPFRYSTLNGTVYTSRCITAQHPWVICLIISEFLCQAPAF